MKKTSVNIVFIIGPQRTGTSWLYSLFKKNSNGVYLDRLVKENEFFFQPSAHTDREKFLKRLSGRGEPLVYVDVCSLYFGHDNAITNIISSFPEAKFVCIRRCEKERKKSFDRHRSVNLLAAPLIGYSISNELYLSQSQFEQNVERLHKIAGKYRCLILDFPDLASSSGKKWVKQLSEFLGFQLEYFDLGTVNSQKKGNLYFVRIMYFPFRVLQFFKVDIVLRRIKQFMEVK